MTRHLIKSALHHLKPGIILYVLIAFSLLSMLSVIQDGSPVWQALFLFTGWLLWTLTEYLVHRFWMHPMHATKNPESPFNHRYHHQHPGEIRVTHIHRVLFLITSVILLVTGFWLNNLFNLFTGFFIGFALYCFLHYWLHQEWTARWLPVLHKSHILHHCKYPERGYGVSTTFWDQLFHTIPPTEANITYRVRLFYFNRKTHKKRTLPKTDQIPVASQFLN